MSEGSREGKDYARLVRHAGDFHLTAHLSFENHVMV